jgi:hypothetical protein
MTRTLAERQDEALEEVIKQLKRFLPLGRDYRERWNPILDNLRALYAAALQQHPTGCYSREDCLAFARWIRDECEVCDGGSTLLSNDEIETMWDDAEREQRR